MEHLLGTAGPDDTPGERALVAMAAAAGIGGPCLDRAARGFGVGSAPGGPARDGETLAVVTGRPVWNDAGLGRLARADGDAAALLVLWRRHGPEFAAHLHGHFACAVLDAGRGEAVLAVDRLGIHGLYHAVSPAGALVFANRLPPLLAHPELDGRVEPQSIYDYVYFHMIPSPGTVYSGVRKLEPAQRAIFRGGEVRVETYWKPEFREAAASPLPELSRELHATLDACVGDRIDANLGLGCFLSGGLDSSTVAGKAAALDARGARTYSIGFDAEGYDETPYARASARHFDTDHHEYYVTPGDVVDSVPRIAAAYGEPFGNSSALPAYHCARLAREDGVELMLAGDGGDELFAGNARYAKQRAFEHYGRLPGWLRRGLVEPALAAFLPTRLPGIGKLRSYVEQARVPLPDRLQSYNFLHRHDPAEVFDAELLASVDTAAPLRALRRRYAEPGQATSLNRMLYLDWKFTLADNDIRKVSETCALAGVAVSYPMLDDRLVDLSCRIPSDLKLRGRRLRYFYRHAMQGFLPPETLRKRKHGFGLPFGVWMQRYAPLRELAYDSLGGLKTRGYFRTAFIDHAVELHRSGHAGYYGELVWILMMLELWLEHHADAQQRRPDLTAAARGCGRAAP